MDFLQPLIFQTINFLGLKSLSLTHLALQAGGKNIGIKKYEFLTNGARILLILMRMWIRILDPLWKKMDADPSPGHEDLFKIY